MIHHTAFWSGAVAVVVFVWGGGNPLQEGGGERG